MTPIRTNLFWAAAFVFLALASWLGLVADKDANTMFVVLPALWVVSAGVGRNCLRRSET
jgi:apolipoprotein N-acyltransferase